LQAVEAFGGALRGSAHRARGDFARQSSRALRWHGAGLTEEGKRYHGKVQTQSFATLLGRLSVTTMLR